MFIINSKLFQNGKQMIQLLPIFTVQFLFFHFKALKVVVLWVTHIDIFIIFFMVSIDTEDIKMFALFRHPF